MSYTDKQIERIHKWERDIWDEYVGDSDFEYELNLIEIKHSLEYCQGDAYQFVQRHLDRQVITDYIQMDNLIELQKIIDTKEV